MTGKDESGEATVKIWHGYTDSLPTREPDHKAELDVYRGEWHATNPRGPPRDAETWYLSKEISYTSPPLEWWVEVDEPVSLFVHTNDSYHDPKDWGLPMEGGLVFGPDIRSDDPFWLRGVGPCGLLGRGA